MGVFFGGNSEVKAQTWSSSTGDWQQGSNWSTGTVPTTSSSPTINNGGTAQISNSSVVVNSVYVATSGSGSLLIQSGGTLSDQRTFIGFNSSASGTVTVTGAGSRLTTSISSTNSNGFISIGYNGTGTLSIASGGSVVAEQIDVGAWTGGNGTLLLSDSTSTLTVSSFFDIGNSGTGTVIISNGAKAYTTSSGSSSIGNYDGGQGSVIVTGSGSLWSTSILSLGGWASTTSSQAPSGSLTITNGGAVISTDVAIGLWTGGTGTATVSGTGSTWTVSSDLYVAYQGTGTLSIANGGSVNANSIYLSSYGGNGTVVVSDSGSKLIANSLYVGESGTGSFLLTNSATATTSIGVIGDYGTGTATVSNGATWTSTNVMVGSNGGIGTLLVSDTGKLITSAIDIGSYSGTGSVLLTGATQTWSSVHVGSDYGTGYLTITNGSVLRTTTASVGYGMSGTGSALVSGTGSQWIVTNNNLFVGEYGNGTLTVANGGTVTSSTVTIGVNAGSTGLIVVDGSNTLAQWDSINVGQNGNGALIVQNGAHLATTTATLGAAAGSSGTVTLSGSNSLWLISGPLKVGGAGTGSILITNGATLSGTVITLGDTAGSNGNITLSGASSTLTYASTLVVGNLGTGSVTLMNGASFTPRGGSLILGSGVGGTGIINIGADASAASATVAGLLNTTTISSGSGSGIVQFRHTATDVTPYYFTNTGTSSGTAVNISGNVSVVNNAGYTVLRGGTYNYTGATQVNGGTLSVASNISGTSQVVVNGGTLLNSATITTTTLSVASGTVSNSGTFSGLNTTNITGGALILGNSLTSPTVNLSGGALIVNPGLSVVGNINSTGGTFATGGYVYNTTGIGTVTASSLTLGANSTTGIRITSLTTSDLLVVNGAATLNGTLSTNFNNSGGYVPHTGDSFTVLTATSVTGSYSGFTNYLDNYYVFTTGASNATSYTLTVSLAQKSFTTAAGNSNQMAVAQALDREISPTGPMLNVVKYVNAMPESEWGNALNLLSPEQLTSAPNAGMANASSLYNMLGGRFTEVRTGQRYSDSGLVMWDPSREFQRNSLLASNGPLPEGYKMANPTIFDNPNFGMFVSGQGTFGDIKGDSNADGYNFNTGGLIIGADYRVGESTVVGLYGGYQGTDTDLSNSGDAKTDSGKFGLYVSQWWNQGGWINFSIGGGYNSYTNKRAGLGDFAKSDTTGMEFNFQAQQGYDFHMGRWTFGPTMEIDYTHLGIDGYSESGSLAPLNVQDQTAESLQGTIGMRVSTTVSVNHDKWQISPYANVGLRHEFLDTQQAVTASFANGSGGAFTVNGPEVDANSVVAGFGVILQLTPHWSGQLGYFAQANDDYLIQSITGSVVYRF